MVNAFVQYDEWIKIVVALIFLRLCYFGRLLMPPNLIFNLEVQLWFTMLNSIFLIVIMVFEDKKQLGSKQLPTMMFNLYPKLLKY
jgi:hypothetical protein